MVRRLTAGSDVAHDSRGCGNGSDAEESRRAQLAGPCLRAGRPVHAGQRGARRPGGGPRQARSRATTRARSPSSAGERQGPRRGTARCSRRAQLDDRRLRGRGGHARADREGHRTRRRVAARIAARRGAHGSPGATAEARKDLEQLLKDHPDDRAVRTALADRAPLDRATSPGAKALFDATIDDFDNKKLDLDDAEPAVLARRGGPLHRRSTSSRTTRTARRSSSTPQLAEAGIAWADLFSRSTPPSSPSRRSRRCSRSTRTTRTPTPRWPP